MQFEILNFGQKIWIFLPALAMNFQSKYLISTFFFFGLILLELHIRRSLNQFVMFVL